MAQGENYHKNEAVLCFPRDHTFQLLLDLLKPTEMGWAGEESVKILDHG